ncbi:MAG: hypothetical protein M1837_006963 [Sclerophora amabilis]|nr:MAG: hypothetical protein M1837_006963 [Sclerophora amabilis]
MTPNFQCKIKAGFTDKKSFSTRGLVLGWARRALDTAGAGRRDLLELKEATLIRHANGAVMGKGHGLDVTLTSFGVCRNQEQDDDADHE